MITFCEYWIAVIKFKLSFYGKMTELRLYDNHHLILNKTLFKLVPVAAVLCYNIG